MPPTTKSPSNRCPTCHRRHKRSNPQNARYWLLLHEIAERVLPAGEQFAAGTWHMEFRKRFLGCEDTMLPSKKILSIPRSSTDLDVSEFNDYMTKVEAWAAERGVFLADMESA